MPKTQLVLMYRSRDRRYTLRRRCYGSIYAATGTLQALVLQVSTTTSWSRIKHLFIHPYFTKHLSTSQLTTHYDQLARSRKGQSFNTMKWTTLLVVLIGAVGAMPLYQPNDVVYTNELLGQAPSQPRIVRRDGSPIRVNDIGPGKGAGADRLGDPHHPRIRRRDDKHHAARKFDHELVSRSASGFITLTSSIFFFFGHVSLRSRDVWSDRCAG